MWNGQVPGVAEEGEKPVGEGANGQLDGEDDGERKIDQVDHIAVPGGISDIICHVPSTF